MLDIGLALKRALYSVYFYLVVYNIWITLNDQSIINNQVRSPSYGMGLAFVDPIQHWHTGGPLSSHFHHSTIVLFSFWAISNPISHSMIRKCIKLRVAQYKKTKWDHYCKQFYSIHKQNFMHSRMRWLIKLLYCPTCEELRNYYFYSLSP